MAWGGAVPVPLATRGVDDVARSEGGLFSVGADAPFALKDVENLLTGMGVPVGSGAILEANQAEGHAARLLGSEDSRQLGLAGKSSVLGHLAGVAAHHLHGDLPPHVR